MCARRINSLGVIETLADVMLTKGILEHIRSDAQKAFILKQGADGMPVVDICRKAGISPASRPPASRTS
jgi:putative transposase